MHGMFPTLHGSEIEDAARVALRNILDARDFLGLRLSNSLGCMSDDDLEFAADEYLSKHDISDNDLFLSTQVLVRLLGSRVDSEVVSTAFRCSFEQAEKALSSVARAIDSDAKRGEKR